MIARWHAIVGLQPCPSPRTRPWGNVLDSIVEYREYSCIRAGSGIPSAHIPPTMQVAASVSLTR